MSLNAHLEETPHYGEFTLENLGLATKDDLTPAGVIGEQTPNAPEAIISTDTTGKTAGQTSMNDNEIESIPDWKSQILIVKEKADKLVDMEDVQKDIEGEDGMSVDKADVIEATFESFYTTRNSRLTYTDFKSKTNLNLAKNFMNQRINESLESLVTEFRTVNTNAIADITKAIVETREFCIDELRDQVNRSINEIAAVREQVLTSVIMLPFSGDRFVDMTKTNLMEIDISEVKQGVPISQEFRLSFDKIKHIWKSSPSVRKVISTMAESYLQTNEEVIYGSPGMIDVKLICSAFNQDSSSLAYEGIADTLQDTKDAIETQAEKVESLDKKTKDIISIISSNSKELLEKAQDTLIARKDAQDINEFAKACSVFLVGLVSLK